MLIKTVLPLSRRSLRRRLARQGYEVIDTKTGYIVYLKRNKSASDINGRFEAFDITDSLRGYPIYIEAHEKAQAIPHKGKVAIIACGPNGQRLRCVNDQPTEYGDGMFYNIDQVVLIAARSFSQEISILTYRVEKKPARLMVLLHCEVSFYGRVAELPSHLRSLQKAIRAAVDKANCEHRHCIHWQAHAKPRSSK